MTIEVTDQASLYLDAWDVLGRFDVKVSVIDEKHIGYRDLRHGQINSDYHVPVSTAPLRYFKRQTITSTWSADYVSVFPTILEGQMNVVIEKGALGENTVSSGTWRETEITHSRDVTATNMYGGKVYGAEVFTRTKASLGSAQSTLQMALGYSTVKFPDSTTTMNDGKPGSVDQVSSMNPFVWPYWEAFALGPTFWGADKMSHAGSRIRPLFGVSPPSEWTATKAVFGATGIGIIVASGDPLTIHSAAFAYTLELSDEDTLMEVQIRLQADRQAAAFDAIPWGVERTIKNGAAKITDRAALSYKYDLWLYSYTSDAAITGDVYEERAQFRFNVPAELRVPGVVYRGRVIQYFYPDSDPYTARVIKLHEVEVKEGQWESVVITPVIPPEDGLTVLQYFSMVAESVPVHPLIALSSGNPSSDLVPPEYNNRSPMFSSQDLVAAGYGTRSIISNSLTLQQINLSDSWGTLRDWPDITVTWSALPGATAQERLWRWHDDGSALGQWSLVAKTENLAPYFGSSADYFFVELLSSGRVTIRVSFNLQGEGFHDDIEIKSGVGEMAVDTNRDGEIHLADEDDSDATSTGDPFRFWSNDDDDDSGPADGNDIPGQASGTADYSNNVVDSVRDLVDFFPVYLDIKQLLTVLPPSASIKYKLKQADGALNFVYTNQTRTHALDYQKKILTTGFGPAFTQAAGAATTQQITAAGVELNTTFLDGIKNTNWGVILVEGRTVANSANAPLRLVIEKDGAQIAEIAVNIKISPVEQMFRHVNLTGVPKNYDGSTPSMPASAEVTRTTEPTNCPDKQTNGKYFVFVHGYNVDGQKARGWQAEVFKRMHALGSKARFVGVTWHGATGLDYHKAVYQAFQTGDALALQLSSVTGNADVTIAAHSLGNMVVSHAIQSGGLSPARYYTLSGI